MLAPSQLRVGAAFDAAPPPLHSVEEEERCRVSGAPAHACLLEHQGHLAVCPPAEFERPGFANVGKLQGKC